MKILYWGTCGTIYFLLKLFYKFTIVGGENLPKGPCIVAANHSSYLDPPIIGSSSPVELHYLARASLFRFPLFGAFIRSVNSHPVDTSGDDIQALRTVIKLLKEGKKVLIFPEGGRSLDGHWMPFKLGVAMLSLHVNVPVVPVVIEGAHEIWKKGQKWPKRSGTIKISYLPSIYPDQFKCLPKKEAQKALTETLRAKMTEAMGKS